MALKKVQAADSTEAPSAHRPGSARERLLAAAGELFYKEGVNTVGIDRVIERAGVAKASLYSVFGSKDELIRAYLEERHALRKKRVGERMARYESPRDKLLAIFDYLGDLVQQSDFRGCAFVRASAEARPGGTAQTVSDESRRWMRGLFTDLAREAGAREPELLAQRLVLIYDGAVIAAQMDHDATAAKAARGMAAALLDAACA
jgi:AcrR family transcriptional regulator